MTKRMVSLALAGLLAVPASWADTPTDSKIEQMSLLEILDLEVVTSSRVRQKLSASHSTVKVITADDIRQLPATTLGELLKLMVPGMDLRVEHDQFIKTYLGIRGLSGDSFAKRILFLMDGRPLNYPVDGDFDTDMRFPVSAIKRIEVVRGPGSSLYGANAFQGTINIITGMDEDRKGGSLTARAGNFGNFGASGIIQQEPAKDLKLFLAFESDRAGEYGVARNLYDLPDTVTDFREGFDAHDVKGRASYKGLSLHGGFHTERVNDSKKGDYVVNPADPRSMQRDYTSHSSFAALEYQRTVLRTVDVTARLHWGSSEKEIRYTQPVVARPGTPLRDSLVFERMEGTDVQASWTPRPIFRLLLGGDFARKRVTSELDRPYVNGRHSRQGSTFAEASVKPVPWLDLVAGGRYDWHSDFASQFSPRLSALGKFLRDKATARVSYGTAFRAPTFTEQYLTRSVFADMSLNPETLTTLEGSASYQFSFVKVTGTVFHSAMQERIVFQRTNGRFIYVNVPGEAKADGVELETDAVVSGKLRIFANYSYQKTKSSDETDPFRDNLVYAPEHKVQGGLVYASRKIDGSLAGYWIGEQRDAFFRSGNPPVPAYTQLHGRVGFRPIAKVTIGVTVKNLLDSKPFDKNGQLFTAPNVATTDPLTRRPNYYAPRTILADVRFNF
jgi:hemoglobin/transferrin/lactoferrin receptor protein